jgi:L-ascorbate metabolism protein UlaG (beta-lactamase superfamily)
MLIEWYGHSCFRIALENGKKIVLDPFDDTVGYEQPKIEANYVLESHQHFDHNCPKTIKGKFEVLSDPGEYVFEGLKITGYETYHDKQKGAARGKNIVFMLQAEGMTVCHMGDLGHIPSADFYEKIGRVDILMIPVGGYFTIDAAEAFEIVEKLQPNITLPMHYRTMHHTDMKIETIHPFLELATGHFDVSRKGGNSLTVTKDQLKKRSRITVLEYIS